MGRGQDEGRGGLEGDILGALSLLADLPRCEQDIPQAPIATEEVLSAAIPSLL